MVEPTIPRRSSWRRVVRWLVFVALVVTPLVATMGVVEHLERRGIAADHERQQRSCEHKARHYYMAGQRALKAGQKQKAAELFRETNYWSGQAMTHERMAEEYRRPWWTLVSL